MAIRISERFKPDPDFKKLNYVYLLILLTFILGIGVITTLPLLILGRNIPTTIAFLPFLILFFISLLISIPSAIWVNLYYASLFYTFTESEILVERGVLWKHRSIVPYNRITNVDIRQGPVQRLVRLWDIHVQTAGYNVYGGGATVAEAYLQGIRNAEEVREFVMSMIRRLKPVAVEAGAETVSPKLDEQILAELKKIREALESKN